MQPADMEAWMDAQCALLGVSLSPEQRPGVLRYLQLVAGLAPRVMDFPLEPSDESGNTFRPVEPRPPLPLIGEAP